MKVMNIAQKFSTMFPPPAFLRMPAAGLDISDRRVRFLMFSNKCGDLSVVRHGEAEIPPGVIVSGKIKRPEELRAILSAFQKKNRLEFVRVSLPEERAYMVKIEVPNSEESDLHDSILFQLEEYVPITAPDAVFDYNVIGESSTQKGYLNVAVSVLSRKEVTEYTTLFDGTGLTTVSFEIEAQAIARAVVPRGDMETYMILDFGRTRTGISVISESIVRFASTVDVGSDMITRAIEKYFSVDTANAEQIKNEKGVTKSESDKDFSGAVMSSLSILRDEVNKLYIYWHTHRESEMDSGKIKGIFLSGGGANLKGLQEYLSAGLRINVEVANPWVNVGSFDDRIPEISYHRSLGYASVIGLALTGICEDSGKLQIRKTV